MRRKAVKVMLAVAVMTFATGFSAVAAQEAAPPTLSTGGETTPATTETAPQPGWLARDTLTGDWGGTGLVPHRSQDTWGFGYYYDALSNPLKDAVSLARLLRNEGGWEVFATSL